MKQALLLGQWPDKFCPAINEEERGNKDDYDLSLHS
jgi:hypothetical protein